MTPKKQPLDWIKDTHYPIESEADLEDVMSQQAEDETKRQDAEQKKKLPENKMYGEY
jgi:hypothetical protein